MARKLDTTKKMAKQLMNREQKEMVKDLKVYYQDVIVKQLMKEFSY